jgi:hypothetical protein
MSASVTLAASGGTDDLLITDWFIAAATLWLRFASGFQLIKVVSSAGGGLFDLLRRIVDLAVEPEITHSSRRYRL